MLQVPTHCPSCQTKLILTPTGIDLVCPYSAECPAQIINKLSYYCGRNLGNITGLSQKILTKLTENFGVRDIADLYDLPYSEIIGLENFGKLSVENMINSIEKSREILDWKFLAGLGIETIGPEVAKLICEEFGNWLNLVYFVFD